VKRARNISYGMQRGKYLESALLGVPYLFESELPIEEAINKGKLVSLLRRNISSLMQQVRKEQKDDPAWPKRPFMRQLLNDIENKLSQQFDLPGSYEVRVYSAVGSVLDLGGIDFWVELYDSEKDKVLADFKVDLKSNPHGRMGHMADYLYYCDEEIAASDDPKAIYKVADYQDLVESTAKQLSQGIEHKFIRSNAEHLRKLQQYSNFS